MCVKLFLLMHLPCQFFKLLIYITLQMQNPAALTDICNIC